MYKVIILVGNAAGLMVFESVWEETHFLFLPLDLLVVDLHAKRYWVEWKIILLNNLRLVVSTQRLFYHIVTISTEYLNGMDSLRC